VTQQQARSADFGPSWPEVTGFGADPNKQFFVGETYKKYATVATVALLAVFKVPIDARAKAGNDTSFCWPR
jgi:hypothetical protein